MKDFLSKNKRRIGISVLCLVLLIGVVLGCQIFLDPLDNRMAPGVTIGGLDVGGMTRAEARQALTAAAKETFLAESLPVSLPEETLSLAPADLEVKLNTFGAVRAAFRVGRTESDTVYEIGLAPYITLNEDAVRDMFQAYAQQYDTELTQATIRMEGDMPELSTVRPVEEITCQNLSITLGLPTAHLDIEAALASVMEGYDSAISACENGTYGVTIEIIPDAVPELPNLFELYDQYQVAPTNDSLDMEHYNLVNGTYGYHFHLASAIGTLASAKYGETVSIPMVCYEPEIYGEGVYFRDLLGHCETKHNNNENRNTNLKLLCAAIDGTVLQPGEEFSYNEVVGERTAERGYKAAPAYSGDRLVNSVGGGVCQGSSTLYNCVLLADLEVTKRVCHGASINYLPLGLDAAVNWGTTDFRFRNSSNFPILLKAEVSDGYVKMQILGTDEKDYYVELEANSWEESEEVTRASSYSLKYSKETGELISRDRIAFSTYYKTKTE